MPRDDDSGQEPEPELEPEVEPDLEADSVESPASAPAPASTQPSVTLPAPLAPWWTAPLESPWAATATPIQRPQDAPSPGAPPAASMLPAVTVPAATPSAATVPAATPPVVTVPEATVPEATVPTVTVPDGNRPRAVQADDAAPVSAIRHANWRATPEPEPARRDRKPLIWSSIVVVAMVVLVSLFFVGQRFVGTANVAESAPTAVSEAAATPSTEPSAEPSAEPTPIADVTAMAAAGTHPWTALYGGECLEPYVSPWVEEFTVADCGTPHSAQLVFRGQFESDPAADFPGEAALAAQIPVLCTAANVINITAAAALADVQVQGSYPVTQAQWDAGQRQYYCFVSRSSGEPLLASLAA